MSTLANCPQSWTSDLMGVRVSNFFKIGPETAEEIGYRTCKNVQDCLCPSFLSLVIGFYYLIMDTGTTVIHVHEAIYEFMEMNN